MQKLNDVLNWKLLDGSHEYPGPEGGTCINEAAIVVAGLPYRKVIDDDDLPPCFSKGICTYLLYLNDNMSDRSRQRLIEFVPRLAGSADTNEIERQRVEYIAIESVRRIAGMWKRSAEAARRINTLHDAIHVLLCMRPSRVKNELFDACNRYIPRARRIRKAANAAFYAGRSKGVHAIDNHCIEIVRGALAIGRQADPIETELIVRRVAKARETAST